MQQKEGGDDLSSGYSFSQYLQLFQKERERQTRVTLKMFMFVKNIPKKR